MSDRNFPYRPPDEAIRQKYKNIFALKEPLKDRPAKLIFDKILSLLFIIVLLPVFVFLWIASKIEGLMDPGSKGPFIYYYTSVSREKHFKKYKIRTVKKVEVSENERLKAESVPNDSDPDNLTGLGRFVKAYYLDEIPQLFCVLKGDMSLVGPRALALEDYERDLANGNVNRKVLKAGLLGEGHVLKGTPLFADPSLEYGYIENYMKLSELSLLWHDVRIIAKGIKLLLEGGGY